GQVQGAGQGEGRGGGPPGLPQARHRREALTTFGGVSEDPPDSLPEKVRGRSPRSDMRPAQRALESINLSTAARAPGGGGGPPGPPQARHRREALTTFGGVSEDPPDSLPEKVRGRSPRSDMRPAQRALESINLSTAARAPGGGGCSAPAARRARSSPAS